MTLTGYTFLLLFLPAVVAGYYLLARFFRGPTAPLSWLVVTSLVFYGALGLGYLVILLGSVLFNFAVGRWMTAQPLDSRPRRWILALGVVGNLALLGTYKYTGFFADTVNSVSGAHLSAPSWVYPVGLSFYTFIQIGYLIDASVSTLAGPADPADGPDRSTRPTFLRYLLFGTFFPYVTAGPIVRPREIFEQLDGAPARADSTRLAVGATMFAMGLFKKAVLADSIAPYAGSLFSYAGGHDTIGVANAWLGMLAYAMQLYFDFSGYTDMALGIAYMLGIRLPANFNSPFKAISIVDFWRRWHMTMTRWFTDFIYIPLATAIMRRGLTAGWSRAVRALLVLCLPVIVTFLAVGLWHGAGWGFVIWGAIQGVAMALNLLWREAKFRMPGVIGWTLTMVVFITSLTFFRAPNLHTAMVVLRSMYGLGPQGAPVGQFYGTTDLFGVVTVIPALLWAVGLLLIAVFFPRNTQQILGQHEVALPTMGPTPATRAKTPQTPAGAEAAGPRDTLPAWRPNLAWAVVTAIVLGAGLVFAGVPSPFLYYQF